MGDKFRLLIFSDTSGEVYSFSLSVKKLSRCGGITIDAADRALKALGITAEIGAIDGDKNSND